VREREQQREGDREHRDQRNDDSADRTHEMKPKISKAKRTATEHRKYIVILIIELLGHLPRMTALEYRDCIEALGLSQIAAAQFLGISPRQSRRLASGERVPEIWVEIVLRLMVKYNISVDTVNRLIKRKGKKK
jgi:hypothetical protein